MSGITSGPSLPVPRIMTLDLTDDEKLARQAPPARDFLITSDPELVSDQADRNIAWWNALPLRLDIAADVTAPPAALFGTGSALGYRAPQS
jgi:hypothetical protein